MTIGILALQGDYIEHIHVFERLGIEAMEIRLPGQLETINGLIIPGGESTTMMNLMHSYKLVEALRKLAGKGVPIWGTCAGMICLARNVHNPDGTTMETLSLMDITVKRNAFGRQVDSFEAALTIAALRDGPFPGVFIRAPYIEQAGAGVDVVCSLPDGRIVAARQGNLLATSFHPELTNDQRVHSYFAEMSRK
jgi:pyridoxal 5'-phosphate synthase pdxT subunit